MLRRAKQAKNAGRNTREKDTNLVNTTDTPLHLTGNAEGFEDSSVKEYLRSIETKVDMSCMDIFPILKKKNSSRERCFLFNPK